MRLEQAFAQLEIPATKNVQAVRKAYARKAALCHPEEDPQGWAVLHQAYTTALDFATGGRKKTVSQPDLKFHNPYQDRWQDSRPLSEYDAFFSQLEAKQFACSQEQKNALFEQLQRLKKHFLPISLSRWMNLFSSSDYLACRKDDTSIRILLEFLAEGKLTCDTFWPVCQQLWDLQAFLHQEDCLALAEAVSTCAQAQLKRYEKLLDWEKLPPIKRRLTRFRWWWRATSTNLKLFILLPLISITVFSVMALLIALKQAWLLIFLFCLVMGALPTNAQKR